MFVWLRRKVERSKIERACTDMDLYIESLKGMTAYELAVSRVFASTVLLNIQHDGDLLKSVFDGRSFDEKLMKTLQVHLEIAIRKTQKANAMPLAAGFILWLHSLRAVMFPPLRSRGKSIWKEMKRGDADFAEAMHQMQLSGMEVPSGVIWDCSYVPSLLDPSRE
nr:hypothetical protein [Alcaligenes faecalis]